MIKTKWLPNKSPGKLIRVGIGGKKIPSEATIAIIKRVIWSFGGFIDLYISLSYFTQLTKDPPILAGLCPAVQEKIGLLAFTRGILGEGSFSTQEIKKIDTILRQSATHCNLGKLTTYWTSQLVSLLPITLEVSPNDRIR